MHRVGLIVAFFVLTSACIPPSPRRGGVGSPAEGGDAVEGDPRETLELVDAHLRKRGYEPLGPAVHNASMPHNGMVAYSVRSEPGTCFVAIALGEEGTDLNMILLDPFGRTAGFNVHADSHPWIAHCTEQIGWYTARVQMARGTGEYYYAAYRANAGSSAELAAFFGGQDATAVEKAAVDAQTASRIASLDATLANKRYARAGEAIGVVLEQGQDRQFPIHLEQGGCYAFASLGGPGVRDTDVSVVDGAGNELARDAEDDGDGLVEFCAPSSGTYQLRARLYEGRGPVFVTGYVKETGASGAPTPPPSQPLIEEESTAGAGLEENFRLLDADMQARGYRSHAEPARGRLEQGQVRDFEVQLEGDKCYALLAVGDQGVRDLDLILLDPEGKQLDRDIEQDARPIVRVCPRASGKFTMRVQMLRGAGNFVYAPYRWPRGTRGPFGLAGIMYVRLAEVTSLLSTEGYAPSPDYVPGKGQIRRQGQSATHDLELKGGECYSLLAVGGEGVSDLDVSLSKGGAEVGTDGTRNAFPSVRHCPEEAGTFRLKVTSAMGAGDYFYQVFTRQAE